MLLKLSEEKIKPKQSIVIPNGIIKKMCLVTHKYDRVNRLDLRIEYCKRPLSSALRACKD